MSKNSLVLLLHVAIALLASTAVEAELTVIHDNGNTHPIAPLMRSLKPVEGDGDRQLGQVPAMPSPAPLGAADIQALLPIASPGLTPAVFTQKKHSEPVRRRLSLSNARPLFLLGADTLSLHWLRQHRKHLGTIGAIGMLVQANTLSDIRRIADIAQGLPIMPGSATDIAAVLGIRHYPVLITKEGLEP